MCDYTRGRDTEAALAAIHSEPEVVGVEATFDVFRLEDDALSLAEGAEQASFEGAGLKIHHTAVIVSDDDAGAGTRIERFDHTLHEEIV